MINWFKKQLWKILIVLGIVGIAVAGISPSCQANVTALEHIQNKPANEIASIKGKRIAELCPIERTNVKFSNADYDIEIISFNAIENGVEIFARAWDKNGQVGFGKNGTVDIERFVFINPPLLVHDPNGDIIKERKNPGTGEVEYYRLREDPKMAILHSLAHTISVKVQKHSNDKIVVGKIGNTTLITYPAAGSNAPVDGRVKISDVNLTWAAIIGGNGTGSENAFTVDSGFAQYANSTTIDQFRLLARGVFGFDTSSVGTDDVSSVVVSLFSQDESHDQGDGLINLVAFTASNDATLQNSDFQNGFGSVKFSTGKAISVFADPEQYENYTLNAAGIAHIDKGGNTFYGSRFEWDIDGVYGGSWLSNSGDWASVYFADISGTNRDPKLVAEHDPAVTRRIIMVQ